MRVNAGTAVPRPFDRPHFRVGAIVALALGISAAHYLTPPSYVLLHNVFQRLYYLPILLACAWLGLRGGLAAAVTCAALYAPHILLHWSHMRDYQANQVLELALFGLIALVAGALSDRERSLRREAEKVAGERDKALRDLQETVETLRRADRLATLGTLAAGLAHEIRNPLGAMTGALDILDSDYPPDHPRREFVDILRHEMERMGGVAGKYLDYARPQAPDPMPLEINGAVRAASDLLGKSAARASVEISCRLDPDLPRALGDPVQVHQALVNLLLNGIQAMPDGGPLEIRTRRSAGTVDVFVRDAGPGLPEGPVDRIFEPFYTTKSGGTGLGLAVARHIARAHGGSLTAANADGGGASFLFSLPAAPRSGEP